MLKTLWTVSGALFFIVACSSSGSSGGGGTSCSSACPQILAAHCPQGPVNETDCESGCSTIQSSSCVSKYNALVACGGPNPKYACDANGQVTIAGCDAQEQALYACISAGG